MTDKELLTNLEKRFGGPCGWVFIVGMDKEKIVDIPSETVCRGVLAVAQYRDLNKHITDVISFIRPTELEALQALEKALDLLSLRTIRFSERLNFEKRFDVWCVTEGIKNCAQSALIFLTKEGVRGGLSTGSCRCVNTGEGCVG